MTDGSATCTARATCRCSARPWARISTRAVARWPDRPALIVREQDVRWSYAELDAQVDAFAAGLLALGPRARRPGRHLVAQQCRVGGHPVRHRQGRADPGQHQPGLPHPRAGLRAEQGRLPGPGHRHQLQDQRLSRHAARARRAAAVPGTPAAAAGDRDPDRRRPRPGRSRSPRSRPSAPAPSARGCAELADRLQFDDPINIQFTSGTTGSPKGATLTHHNILNNGYFIGEAQKLGPDDKVCIPVPLYHCFGMVLGNLACITHGSAMVYPGGGFDPLAVLQTVHEERCTALYGVPTMFIAELGHPEFGSLRPLLACAPASWPARPARSRSCAGWSAEMHMGEVTIAYGMTETSPVSFQSSHRRPARAPGLDRRPHPPACRGQDRRRRGPHRAARHSPASCAPAATR